MADRKRPEAGQRRPRWEDEEWIGEQPDPKKIMCTHCALRAEDRKLGSSTILGATLGVCKAFESKPNPILFNGAVCLKYQPEKRGG